MDNNNVIELTNDLKTLELDMTNWSNLPFEMRKRSDVECIQKYGCTNIELYNSIKANIIKNEPPKDEPIYMNEDFHIIHDDRFNDVEYEVRLNNIQDSLFIQKQDHNIVIINDFISDTEPDYDMEQLLILYDRYTRSNNNYKIYSNEYSLQIWGKTVPEMFNYMKSKLQRIKDNLYGDKIDLFVSPVDKALIRYQQETDKARRDNNFIEFSLKAIDGYSKHDTLYESVVMEESIKDPFDMKIDYKSEIPYIVPILTYDEYIKLNGESDVSPFDYIMIEDPKKYYDLVSELSTKFIESKSKVLEEQLLKLGWNPAVPVNGDSIKFARNKQIAWLNKNEQCNIINLSKTNIVIPNEFINESEEIIERKIEPIYIVLVHTDSLYGKVINKYKKSIYSHAGISLSPILNEIYSFGIRSRNKIIENGLIIETLDDYCKNIDANLLILALFVDPVTKEKIIKNIKWYMDNKDNTKYSLKNIGRIILNKETESKYSLQMVCSQFVDNLLKISNLDITGKPSNLVAPNDLDKPIKGVNIYTLFEGKRSNYNYLEIQDKVDTLKKTIDYRRLSVKSPEIIIKKIRENVLEVFRLTSDNSKIESVLKELRDYLTIKPGIISISEVKSPIGFNKNGGLYLELPKNLQAEYNEAHKLLQMYDITNIQGIKHELARLFYLNSIIERKLKKTNKEKTPEAYKELIDLRARILNDYSTYFKIVKQVEKDFDFMEYMKGSEYYNKYLVVDDSTLKYSGSYIKKFIQSMIKK